jgi:hypothetical protein
LIDQPPIFKVAHAGALIWFDERKNIWKVARDGKLISEAPSLKAAREIAEKTQEQK